VAGALLAADGDPEARALILTGEKAFTPTIAFSPARTVMGEGTAACLVRLGGDRDRLLAYATATYGEYHNTMSLDAALTARFQQAYPALLAEVIREATDRAGLRLADLAMIVPHNSNRVSWVHTCRLLGFPLGQVFLDNIPVTGHCFCADPFVNYVCVTERGLLRRGEAYLLVSVGLGATFSAMVFRH
jgi:3-oxoacyl-[acyl-carrier-protein] synthase-3